VGLNEQFNIDNADLGIVLIEVLQSAQSAADLDSWTMLTGYPLVRTEPADLMETAFVYEIVYPISLIVDAQTMEVVASCFDDWKLLGPMDYTEMLEVCFELNTEIVF
jgi:hypothetical protein